jgi:hypothetical protein
MKVSGRRSAAACHEQSARFGRWIDGAAAPALVIISSVRSVAAFCRTGLSRFLWSPPSDCAQVSAHARGQCQDQEGPTPSSLRPPKRSSASKASQSMPASMPPASSASPPDKLNIPKAVPLNSGGAVSATSVARIPCVTESSQHLNAVANLVSRRTVLTKPTRTTSQLGELLHRCGYAAC